MRRRPVNPIIPSLIKRLSVPCETRTIRIRSPKTASSHAQGSFVRYVSTRGEAPPLGFMDVTLAGLARDGGLYVPESWPRLSAETIASFAGKPYAEVAVEVIRPFVGDTISEAELSRLAREAYGTFRHPAVVPVAQF